MKHISELTVKLNKACYAIRTIKPYMSLKVLKTIYFSYFHSLMTYGIIFWGNSHLNHIIFKIQKRIIRIIANKGKRESCRNLYKQLQILTLPSFSLLVFVVRQRNLFVANSEIHNINTCFNQNLHLPTTKLTLVQKGVFYSGSKIYNLLPSYINSVNNDLNNFKCKLKTLVTWKLMLQYRWILSSNLRTAITNSYMTIWEDMTKNFIFYILFFILVHVSLTLTLTLIGNIMSILFLV